MNETFLDNIPNSWSKLAYEQIFDCDRITFKKSVNMFKRMYIAESIHKGVLEPSYEQSTREDATYADHSIKKRVESAFSHTCS